MDVFEVIAEKSRGLVRRIWTRLVCLGGYPTYTAVAAYLRGGFAVQLVVAWQCIACHDGALDNPRDA